MKRPRTLAEQRKNVRKLARICTRQLSMEKLRALIADEVSRQLVNLRIARGDR